MTELIPSPYRAVLPTYAYSDPFLLNSLITPTLITFKKTSISTWHDYFQIWYVSSGEYVHVINGKKHLLKSGDAVVIPPYMVHKSDLSISDMSKLRLIRIKIHISELSSEALPLFSTSCRSAFFKTAELQTVVSFSPDEKKLADGIMEKLLSETERKQLASISKKLALLSEFFDLYTTNADKHISEDKLKKYVARMQLIQTAIAYISSNQSKHNLSIDEIAAHVNMSRRSLTDTFFALVGRTVHSYITAERLVNAQGLLRSYTMSISEVARVCGFSNSSHFSSCFKKEFGCTPFRFRREFSDWQVKYGDFMYRNDIDSMKWFFEPDEAAIVRHWTSMNFTEPLHRNKK